MDVHIVFSHELPRFHLTFSRSKSVYAVFFSRLFLSLASISFRTLCICTAAGLIRFTMDFDAMMPTQKESLRVSFDACLIFDSLETVQFSFHFFLLLFTMQFFFSLALFILPHNILSS